MAIVGKDNRDDDIHKQCNRDDANYRHIMFICIDLLDYGSQRKDQTDDNWY